MMAREIVRYGLAQSVKGEIKLLAYFADGDFCPLHSNELTKLERWILAILKGECERMFEVAIITRKGE